MLSNRIPDPLKSKWGLGVLVVVLLVVGYYFFALGDTGEQELITVTRDSITETVSVTGNTVPTESVELGFGSSGRIARVDVKVGDSVSRGQVLASLSAGDEYAQVIEAQARLDGLRAGSRPEEIASSQAALDKAKQDLVNMYQNVSDTSADSYAKANDAVRVQLDQLFMNDETNSPILMYVPNNSLSIRDAEEQRVDAREVLDEWNKELPAPTTPGEAEAFLTKNISQLAIIRQFLDTVSKTLLNTPSLTSSEVAAYKAQVTAALNEVNTASKNLNTLSQNIASQKLIVSQAQAQLDLKKSGTASQDIRAQEAQVMSAQARLQDSRITSPINGLVTQFDAKVGQYASPGTVLVSVISGGAFDIEAQVSETDVGKIAIGNKVSMTLDAFPNETFSGSISYVDPAQTTTEGVVGYKIKVAFDKADERMKSGLTANIDIETRHKENVLIVPQYAILQNDDGTFVQVKEGDSTKDIPVTLGLVDRDGNVEVVSGVNEGQQVLNIGLKTQ